MFRFFIGFSRQRTLGGKRFVSASLAAPEGIADVTNTESRRFRQSPLAKAIDVPRSEHVASSKELLVGLVAREVLLTEISKHHVAIVQAVSAQESNRLPHNVSHLAINTAKSISVACGVHQRARTSRLYARLATKQVKTLTTLRCVRLKVPCRAPPGHSASERGERASSNHIEVCATWSFNCTRGKKNT